MLVPLLIFSISLVLIIVMLFYRIHQMRLGKVELGRTNLEENIWPEINVASLRNRMADYTKRYGHLFVLLLLRLWIKFSYFAKRKKQIILPKIKSFLQGHKDKLQKSSGPASRFLANISEYKAELKKMKEKIEEQEEQRK